jgi:hypothetical protein
MDDANRKAESVRPPEPRVVRWPADVLRLVVDFAQSTDETERRAIWELDRLLMVAAPQMNVGRLQDRPADEIAALRSVLLSSLTRFARRPGRNDWWVPLDSPLTITQLSVWRADSGALSLAFDGPWPAAFWFAAAALVQAGGDLILICPQCGRMFVKRGRSEHCSTQCGQAKRSAKHYQQHRDKILRQRHERHARKVKQKYPKAKVTRRPRQAGKGQS